MPTTSRALSPEAMSRIQRLELEAREVVEGFLSGQHRSPYLGQSLEFAQHREYVAGDDIRRIDWKAWSKTDKLYLKQYEEETNLRLTLVVDASESMRFGSQPEDATNGKEPRTKFDQACRLAAALAYLMLRQQDSVGIVTFDDDLQSQVPHRTAQSHLQLILESLAVEQPSKKTSVSSVLRRVADMKTLRGMVVIISDLFVPSDDLRKGLELLRQRRHEVVVMQMLDDAELNFDFAGTTKFIGLEESGELTCDPRSLRAGYLKKLDEFLDATSRTCLRAGTDYSLVRTSDPIGATLGEFLARRSRPRR